MLGRTSTASFRWYWILPACLAASVESAWPARAQTFVPQGPGPSIGAIETVQSGDVNGTQGTVGGAVQTIVTVPGDPNTMYISGVNGGVWKTANAGASWAPLTDHQASLSIASLALDPTDPTNKTLIAGVGITSNGALSFNSSFSGRGGGLTGLLYSSNGGTSWQTLGGDTLSGRSVLGVAARGSTILAATYDPYAPNSIDPNYGLYRSVNGGASFEKIDVAAGTGSGPTTSLVGDPANAARLFVATTSDTPNESAIHVTNNTGAAWQTVFDRTTPVTNGTNVINTIAGQTIIKLAAGSGGALAAGVIDASTRQLAGLYLSLNGGQTWTALSIPTVDGGIHPGQQALTNFGIAIDPNNPRIVYIAGDRQDGAGGGTFPNSTGAVTYTATVWRAVLNGDNTTTLASMTDLGAANGTTVHADSRNIAFDAAGRLILVGDGGIYARTQPQSAAGSWTGLNSSTLQLREIYGIGYDSISNRLVVAAQDTGAAIQQTPGSTTYAAVKGGDGTVATVNDTSLAGRSTIYTTSQSLGGLDRTVLDRNGNLVAAPTQLTLSGFVGTDAGPDGPPFSSKFVLNRYDQSQIAIGTNYVYTTQDPLNVNAASATLNLTLVSPQSGGTPLSLGWVTALAYGAFDDHNAILAGAGNGLYLKQSSDATLQQITGYPALSPTSVVFGNRVREFYVADTGQLLGTTDKGVTFTPLTPHLPDGFSRPTALEFIANNGVNALLVGGLGARANVQSTIAVADSDGNGDLTGWRLFGTGLPNAQVSNLVYNPLADALAVATFGRGAFLLYDVTSNFAQATTLQFGLANNDSLPDAAILTNGTSANRALIKYGTGTLAISGAASYTGGTTINNGTLQIGIGGSAGTILGNVAFCADPADQLCNATTNKMLAFNRSDTFAFDGVISGPGQVRQVGPGTTILTADSTYTGPTTIDAGTLQIDGSVASAVKVNAGGTLSGSGTTGDIVVGAGGILAPGRPQTDGSAPGPLRTNGDLTLQPGSAAVLAVGATSVQLAAAGTATLGGTAFLKLNPGPVARHSVLIASQGGNLGRFDTVQSSNLPSYLSTQLIYGANELDVQLTSQLTSVSGLSRNQNAVATVLDRSFNSGNGTLFDIFKYTTGAQISPVLTSLTGESTTGTQQMTFSAMSQFLGTMLDPSIDGRGAPDSFDQRFAPASDNLASAYTATSEQPRGAARDAYAMLATKAARTIFVPSWSVWAAGFGGSQTTDGRAATGSNTATSRLFGTAVGADYWLSPYTVAGFALAGGGTTASVSTLGTSRADLFQAGAYLRHQHGPAYVAAALAYGWQDITTDRTVTIAGADRLRAEFNANTWSGRLEGGYRFVMPWLGGVGLTPYIAGDFTSFALPAYTEAAASGSGTFALAFGAKRITDTRSELGLRADRSFAVAAGLITLRGRLAWAHDYDPDRSATATFQSLPGASFVVNGASPAADSALTTATVEQRWTGGWSIATTFEGEFSEVTRSYGGKLMLRNTW